MFAQFQANYQRVDASLQKLVDSIAAYNPSTSAAEELLAADSAVNANLDTLITHQRNHQTIENLRQTAASLDETIKTTISLLADTRKQIQAIAPASSSDTSTAPNASSSTASSTTGSQTGANGRDVDVDTLLRYAKFISKTTVPPTFRRPPVIPPSASQANGAVAHAAATPAAAAGSPTPADPSTTTTTGASSFTTHLPADATSWLDIAPTLQWAPWPSLEAIAASALADIQKMVDNGQDPSAVLTAEEAAEAERRKADEEAREQEEQRERERRRREAFETAAPLARRGTAGEEEVAFNPDDL